MLIAYALSFFLPVYILYYSTEFRFLHFRGFINSIPFMLLLFSPAFLLNKFAKCWLLLFYLVVIFPAVLCGVHIYFFDANISYQAIASILVTSVSEAKEFLDSQFSFLGIFWGCFLIFFPLIFLKKIWKFFPADKTNYRAFVIVLALCGISFFCIGKQRFLKDSQVWIVYSSIYEYYKIEKDFSRYLEIMKSVKIDNVCNSDDTINKTLVVLIGESSSRHHWGLYGYFRDTTPRLNKIKDELFIFKNAVNPTPFTHTSLIRSLFFEELGIYQNFPIIPLLQQTGYKVYWVSNQATAELGLFNYLALMSDEKQYLNRSGTHDYKYKSYDENLLEALEEILKQNKNQNKIIFMHTMGSHSHYQSRYPEEFNAFNSSGDLTEKKWRRYDDFNSINCYDNSINYTDFIVSRCIEMLKNEKNSSLLYFSDHGEDVFDVMPYHGRNAEISSRYMVDIPVLFWLSEDMKQILKDRIEYWQTTLERPFMTDILSLMICDLLNIKIPSTAKDSCNPLNPAYKAYERIVEGKNYDVIFSGEKGLLEPVMQSNQ